MSLLEQAKRDTAVVLEDDSTWGAEVSVRNPAGESQSFNGQFTDVHLSVDPETGLTISGRNVSVVLSIASLMSKFGELPVNKPSGRPWVVTKGAETFKVIDSMPDATLGQVQLKLGAYVDAAD